MLEARDVIFSDAGQVFDEQFLAAGQDHVAVEDAVPPAAEESGGGGSKRS